MAGQAASFDRTTIAARHSRGVSLASAPITAAACASGERRAAFAWIPGAGLHALDVVRANALRGLAAVAAQTAPGRSCAASLRGDVDGDGWLNVADLGAPGEPEADAWRTGGGRERYAGGGPRECGAVGP